MSLRFNTLIKALVMAYSYNYYVLLKYEKMNKLLNHKYQSINQGMNKMYINF